jgi:hypothetical protein
MDIIGLRVPTQNCRDFPSFHVSPTFKNCPSARRATAAIQIVVIWTFSEGKLSQSVRFDITFSFI